MEELLQKHRTFVLSVAVGGFVFLVALALRGCAVYDRPLVQARAKVQRQASELASSPVPDEKYLRELDRVVEAADARVADLANEVGRTARGERLWEECIGDILGVLGEDTPEARRDIMERARRLPSAAFSLLVERARTVFAARAAQADMEIVQQAQELGFEHIQDAGFSSYLASMAAIVRVVDRAIALGVDRIEFVSAAAGAASGAQREAAFVQSVPVRFVVRGSPGVLAELLKSLNDRDRDGKGRRLVLDQVDTLGRPETVRAGEPGKAEFTVRVMLVDLEAAE